MKLHVCSLKFIFIQTKSSLNKTERLKSRKSIDYLFSNGKSIVAFPVKVNYVFSENDEAQLKAGFTVSAKKFKRAVDRNRIKRMMREAYRLQKNELNQVIPLTKKGITLFFIYLGAELPVYTELHQKIGLLLQRIKANALKE